MAIIYDLDNEGGGNILQDSDGVVAALRLNSNAPGYPALAINSTISGSPVQIDTLATPSQFRSASSIAPALYINHTVNSVQTVAPLRFAGTSVASAAILEFQGGFISCTSTVLTSVANTDYAIPVQVGLETRYIPLFKAAAIIGGAAF
jgi:hypothetical protein